MATHSSYSCLENTKDRGAWQATVHEVSESWTRLRDYHSLIQFSSLQLLSPVRLFGTPWTAACQASLPITNSQSLPKLMSIESVMPSNHLILSSLSPPALNLSQHQGLFKWVSSSHQVAKLPGIGLEKFLNLEIHWKRNSPSIKTLQVKNQWICLMFMGGRYHHKCLMAFNSHVIYY